MKKLTPIQEQRILELLVIQMKEVENNFANGELWNQTEDKIYFLKTYGQENRPTPIYDEDDCECGYELNDGTKVFWSGMTFENSY